MPIEAKCSGCNRRVRVAEKYAGKKIKCPACKGIILLPTLENDSAETESSEAVVAKAEASKPESARGKASKPEGSKADSSKVVVAKQEVAKAAAKTGAKPTAKKPAAKKPAPKPAEDKWYLQTEEGEQYGPVDRAEIEAWLADGRIDDTCQLLKDGWEQWKWAEEVFPEVTNAAEQPESDNGDEADEDNPFAGLGISDSDSSGSGEINPFESPAVSTEVESSSETNTEETSTGGITPAMEKLFGETRPWVSFLAIIGLIYGGLAALGCLGGLVGAVIVMLGNVGAGLVLLLVMLVYAVLTGIFLYVSFSLLTYASQVTKYLRSKTPADLEKGLAAQKTVFMMTAIMVAASILLPILLLILAFLKG